MSQGAGGPTLPDVTAAPRPAQPEAAPVPPWKNPFVIAFILGALVLTILPFLQRQTLRAPPPLASLGSWQLTDEQGAAFGSAELKGSVWIASFFFTRCPSVCPRQQAALLSLLPHVEDLRGREGVAPIALVSFTVDPEHDTPPILRSYEEKMRAGSSTPGDWHLLTGPREALAELLVKRFMVTMGDKRALDGSADLFDISHTPKFALVDQNGDVRGFWGNDDLGRGNLINAARLLAKEGVRP